MTQAVDITADQRRTILALLNRHLPGTTVWACGSRTKWTSRPESDLDLVAFARPEQSARVADLREAFEESNLPFRVDLFVWDEAPESFRARIEAEHVVLVEKERVPCTDNEWPKVRIGEIAQIVGGSTPSTKDAKNFDGDVPWLTPKDLAGPHDRVVMRGSRNLSRTGLSNCSAKLVPPGTVCLSIRAPIGYVAIAGADISTNQGFRNLILKNDICSEFIYYWLKANTEELERHAAGTTFRELSGSTLKGIHIPLPSFREQRAIAHVLATLDDKIELNRRMNETLEAMARALFKSWFVDFDPVRAKMEGRDTGLPESIADLFPDRLADSECGEIPVGWKAGRLADIATAPRRNVDPAGLDDEIPYIGLEHMPRRSIALTAWERVGKVTSNKSVFEKGEVLFGKLRPYFHKVGVAPIDGVCSTDIVVIAPKSTEWSAFVLTCVSSVEFVSYTNQGATGTKMPRTNWPTMGDYRIRLPTAPVAGAFENAIRPGLERISANVHESHTLAGIRDTLLPKLVSGELRTENAAGFPGGAS